MKAILTAVIVSVFMLSSMAAFAATDLGPAAPYGDAGQLSLGLGYAYYASKWKSDNDDIPLDTFKQSNGYLQLNYAFISAWEVYVRVGFGDAEFKTQPLGDPFNNPVEFSIGYRPFVGLGFKGLAHNGEKWDMGPFVQYIIYSEYDNLWQGAYESYYLSAEMTVESLWDLAVGGAFSYKSDFATLTLSPYIFWSKANATLVKTVEQNNQTETETSTGTLEEKNIVGGMFGVMVPMGGGYAFNVEAQYQSNLSFSVSATKVFGSDD